MCVKLVKPLKTSLAKTVLACEVLESTFFGRNSLQIAKRPGRSLVFRTAAVVGHRKQNGIASLHEILNWYSRRESQCLPHESLVRKAGGQREASAQSADLPGRGVRSVERCQL